MAFRFKKFSVEDDRCSMKVGTDAVILGAWAKINTGDNVLDIGTGSGVIALMLAQRSENNPIDALEIDQDSVLQAKQNVLNSPWPKRINIIHERLQDYCRNPGCKYELIVSNPPYFEKSLKPGNTKKQLSKHSDRLSHKELFYCVNLLLKAGGRFIVIIPFTESGKVSKLGLIEGFFINKMLEIYTRPEGNPERLIFEFSREKNRRIQKSQLLLRNTDGSYTEEYKALTKAFYLNF